MWGIWSTISYGVESQPWQNLGEGCFLMSQPESLWILFSPPEVPYYLGGELWQEWAVLLWWYGTCVNKANTKPRWRGRWYLDPLIAICTMAQWPAPDGYSVYQHNGLAGTQGPFWICNFHSFRNAQIVSADGSVWLIFVFPLQVEKLMRLYCTLLILTSIVNKWALLLKVYNTYLLRRSKLITLWIKFQNCLFLH